MDGLRKVSFVALLPICAYLIIGKPAWATALAQSPYSVPTLSIAAGGVAVLMGPVAAALVTATGALMMYDVCNARVDRELKMEEIRRDTAQAGLVVWHIVISTVILYRPVRFKTDMPQSRMAY